MDASPCLLSLCMIVRNEEDNISACLDSVKNVVDEIIIVDTGSEDATSKIINEYGIRIYEYPWQNNFSAARNFALDKATGEWILVLDADEVLDKWAAHSLRSTLFKAKEEGFYLIIQNYQDSRQNYIRTYALRLFRNNPSYRYEGRIHEQIFPSIKSNKPQARISWSPWIIHHYGYSKSVVRAKNKAQRNLAILLSESPEVKESGFFHLCLGLEYLRLGDLIEAEVCLKKGWDRTKPEESYAHLILAKLIVCLHLQKKEKEALSYCWEGLKIYPDYPDIYYYCGVCLLKTGNIEQARDVLLKGLRQGNSPNKYTSESGCGTHLNYFVLGRIEERCNNYELAVSYYLQALRLHPHSLPYLKGLIRNLFKGNLDTKSYLAEHNLLTKDSLFYSWIYAAATEDYHSALEYAHLLKDHDKRQSKLLKEFIQTLRNDSEASEPDDYKAFRNQETVLIILKIIDEFAYCKAAKASDRMVSFLFNITDEDFAPLIFTILYKRECYEQALKVLETIPFHRLDEQEMLMACDLYKRFGKEAPPC